MRLLLVLALIPLLAACSVFSSSEKPASLADTASAGTAVAGATDSTGVPAGETSPSDAAVSLSPTSTATSARRSSGQCGTPAAR